MTNCGFAQISNAVLLDERISFKARGILALLLSRPANWRIYINEISERSTKEGKKAIQSGFKELVDYGYLQLISFVNKETGRFEGKGYVICKKTKTHRQRPFSTVLKTDHPITGSSPKRIDLKEDRPQMVSYNNTEGSNTKNYKMIRNGKLFILPQLLAQNEYCYLKNYICCFFISNLLLLNLGLFTLIFPKLKNISLIGFKPIFLKNQYCNLFEMVKKKNRKPEFFYFH